MNIKRVLFLVLCAIVAVLAIGVLLSTMTVRSDREKVVFNQCTGQLILLRNVILLYREQRGAYPGNLTNLVPEYVQEKSLWCPKLRQEGKNVAFSYFAPTNSADTNHWLLKTPTANYDQNGKPVSIQITAGGVIQVEP